MSSRNFLQHAPIKVPRSLNNPVRAKQKQEREEREESERKKLRRQARNDENLDSSEEDEDEEHDGNWEHVAIEVVEVDDIDNLYTYDVAEADPPRPVSPEIKVPRFAAYRGGAKPNSRLGEGTKRSIMDEEAEAVGAAARPGGETVTAAAFFAHVLHIFQMVRWCVWPYKGILFSETHAHVHICIHHHTNTNKKVFALTPCMCAPSPPLSLSRSFTALQSIKYEVQRNGMKREPDIFFFVLNEYTCIAAKRNN